MNMRYHTPRAGWFATLGLAVLMRVAPVNAAPAEEFRHRDATVENWSVHGHLRAEDGSEWGVTAMFFTGKYLVLSGTAALIGLADVAAKALHFDYAFFVPFLQKVRYGDNGLLVEYGRSSLVRTGPQTVRLDMSVGTTASALDLQLPHEPMPYAGIGESRWAKGHVRGYTFMGAKASGTLRIEKRAVKVEGAVNLDHGWAGQMGHDHDMMMLELDDGSFVNVLFRHPRKGGSALPGSFMDVADAAGTRTTRTTFAVNRGSMWESPVSGAPYPATWTLVGSEADTRLNFTPAFENQEVSFLFGAIEFWTGVGRVEGVLDGRPVSGHFCAMMQGYQREGDAP
ncbi:MAG: hypothetical protein HYY13_02315 [Nitrospirae bacterium]|nr:hypothetical protein [Nitrospirota bacterium]